MKVFPSYAANPEKWQFSFRSPKSTILSSVIGKFVDTLPDDTLPDDTLPDDTLPIRSSNWHHFFYGVNGVIN